MVLKVHIKKEGVLVDKKDRIIAELREEARALKEENALLKELSIKDSLTGALNQRGTEEAFLRMRELAHRHSILPLFIVVIDVDHFKLVNDTHGHPVGDMILKEVVERLQLGVRASDIVGRWGGEEFIILLQGGNIVQTVKRLHRLLCKAPYRTKAKKLVITVSIGVSRWNPDESLDTLFEKADAALYQAKEDGRNRVVFAQN